MTVIAYHEAAHAVAHIVLGYTLHEVTIASSVEAKLGHTHGDVLPETLKQTNNWRRSSISAADWQAACDDTVVLLVGEIAEARFTGATYCLDPHDPTSTDQEQVLGRLAAMRPGDYAAQDALLVDLTERAVELVDENWALIGRVATALLEATTLGGAAVKAAMDGSTGI